MGCAVEVRRLWPPVTEAKLYHKVRLWSGGRSFKSIWVLGYSQIWTGRQKVKGKHDREQNRIF